MSRIRTIEKNQYQYPDQRKHNNTAIVFITIIFHLHIHLWTTEKPYTTRMLPNAWVVQMEVQAQPLQILTCNIITRTQTWALTSLSKNTYILGENHK